MKTFARALFGLAVATAPCSASADLGVAFVHGTGRQTDAYHDYWTPEFVDSIASGLPDPSLVMVASCDFSQAMWHDDAAGCLADQMLELVEDRGADEIVVVTHSNGGNVVRWILSNPTYDPRYPRIIDAIRWVDALAPSSLGTPLADAAIDGTTFETSVGWLFGYGNDAVAMQQTSTMALYNSQWLLGTEGRPALPVGFWAVVGTDVQSSPFDPDSQCGGYARNVGLELTQNWLGDCSDGFLECRSQSGAGELWRYDTDFTAGGEPLSHAQSRRACFGLDGLLRADLEEAGS
ncbi:MAG TPA: hypothetical protein VFG69_14400 [Nannocystaceae bacterium]|nr:hypothetical protein [Nannocystaceae bacterium]